MKIKYIIRTFSRPYIKLWRLTNYLPTFKRLSFFSFKQRSWVITWGYTWQEIVPHDTQYYACSIKDWVKNHKRKRR